MIHGKPSGAMPSNDGFGTILNKPNQSDVPSEPIANEPCQKCLEAKKDAEQTIRIRISLFFDGTLNNRENAASNPLGLKDGSYQNAVL